MMHDNVPASCCLGSGSFVDDLKTVTSDALSVDNMDRSLVSFWVSIHVVLTALEPGVGCLVSGEENNTLIPI